MRSGDSDVRPETREHLPRPPLPVSAAPASSRSAVHRGPVRAAFRVDARVGEAQALNRAAVHQVLLHNFGGIFGLHVPVPDCFGIDDDGGAVLALVEASGLIDAHAASQACLLGNLLQPGVQFALSIRSTGGPGSAFRTGIMADKNMVPEWGQTFTPCISSLQADGGEQSFHI